jgi:hypothetical protein
LEILDCKVGGIIIGDDWREDPGGRRRKRRPRPRSSHVL